MITFFSRKTLASRINVAFNNTFSISNYNSLVFKANFSSTSYLNVNDGKRNKLVQEFSPGLTAVENIILSNDSDFNKQLKIEETFRYL